MGKGDLQLYSIEQGSGKASKILINYFLNILLRTPKDLDKSIYMLCLGTTLPGIAIDFS